MNGTLFTLVNIEDRNEVFAWGMEITFDQPDTETERRVAILYRPDLGDQRDMHSKHSSAESARTSCNRALPIELELMWHD